MKHDPRKKTSAKTATNRKWKAQWKKVVSVLAAITVFCTTYALILPAITVNSDTYCGLEEHEHTEKCYTRELVCGLEEGEISSGGVGEAATTETVTEIQQVLVDEGHTHQDSCYEEISTLVCGQEETEATEESEGHTHTEECYQVERTLICNEEEREAVYEEKEVTVEKEVEASATGEPHVHTDACYKEVLTCGKEEHKHTDECFSNPSLDLETAADWEKTLPKEDELKGNWAEDVLTIAKSQLGYKESSRNFVVSNGERKGYTRYGAWYGAPYSDWCAMFIQFCMHYAGVDERLMPASAGVGTWIKNVSKLDNYFLPEDFVPQPGDIVFIDWDSKPGDDPSVRDGDHVGLVAEVKTEEQTTPDGAKMEVPVSIITIEGNLGGEVRYYTYKIDDDNLMGYARMPEKPENEEELEKLLKEIEGLEFETETEEGEEADDSELPSTIALTSYTESGVQVNFTAPMSVFPEGTVDPALNVVEILPGTPEYEEYRAQAETQVAEDGTEVVDAKFFDITVVDVNGNEIKLNDESLAKVEIIFPQNETMTEDGDIDVLHFAEEGLEVLGSETQGSGEVDAVTFDTPGFSVFGVVQVSFTVDYFYTAEGSEETVEYHQPGRTTMMMSELFEHLGINKSVSGVVDVEFTDDTLVTFEPQNGDYLITSLVPFTTAEELTIHFSDGETLVISVEDDQYIHNGMDVYINTWARLKATIQNAINSGDKDIKIYTGGSAFGATETIEIPAGVKVSIYFARAKVGRAVDKNTGAPLPADASKRGPFFDVKSGGELYINGANFTGYGVPIDPTYGTYSSNQTLEKTAVVPNASAVNGKGIYINSAGTVTLTNSSVADTNARRGPAPEGQTGEWTYPVDPATVMNYGLHNTAPIVSQAGSLTIDSTVFMNNYLYEKDVTSTNTGSNAGVVIANGNLTITNCGSIKDNVASGGMIIHSGGTGLIQNSTIDNCRVDGTEAAPIVSKSGSNLTLSNTHITGNIAQYPHWRDDGSTVVDKGSFNTFFTKMTEMSLQGGSKNRIEPYTTVNSQFPNGGYFYGLYEASREDLPDPSASAEYQEAYKASQYSSDGYLGNDPIRTAGALLVNGGNVTMKDNSTMKENLADHGAVLVTNGGTFTMESGEISGNKGYHAGAVGIASKLASEATSTFNFKKGTISDNATLWYGTVTVSELNSRFTMGTQNGNPNDTVIKDNFSLHKGGAIYINSNDTDLMSGKLHNNTAAIFGGGIYLERYRELELEATEITKNTASSTLHSKAGVEFAEISGGTGDGKTWHQKYWANLGAGLGGGLWSCPTGRTFFDNNEVAVYKNTAATDGGQDFSIRNHADKLTFITNEKWEIESGPKDGTETTTPTDPSNFWVHGSFTELRMRDADTTSTTNKHFVITNNEAPCGGGIASNGNLYLTDNIERITERITFVKQYSDGVWHNVKITVKLMNGTQQVYAETKEIKAAGDAGKVEFRLPTVAYSTKNTPVVVPAQAQAYERLRAMGSFVMGENDLGNGWKLVLEERVDERNNGNYVLVGDTTYTPTTTVTQTTTQDDGDNTTINHATVTEHNYISAASLTNTEGVEGSISVGKALATVGEDYINDDEMFYFNISILDGNNGVTTYNHGVTFKIIGRDGEPIVGNYTYTNTSGNTVTIGDTDEQDGIRKTRELGTQATNHGIKNVVVALRAGERIEFKGSGLVGKTYTVSEIAPSNSLYEFVNYQKIVAGEATEVFDDLEEGVGPEVLTAAHPAVLVMANNREISGSLEVKKELVGVTGNNNNEEFEFNVTINGNSETITLKANQTKSYPNLPIGSTWTVEEVNIASKFKFKEFTVDGSAKTATATENGYSVSGTVSDTNQIAVVAKNEYNRYPIYIKKTNEDGSVALTGASFTVRLATGGNSQPFTPVAGQAGLYAYMNTAADNHANGTPYLEVGTVYSIWEQPNTPSLMGVNYRRLNNGNGIDMPFVLDKDGVPHLLRPISDPNYEEGYGLDRLPANPNLYPHGDAWVTAWTNILRNNQVSIEPVEVDGNSTFAIRIANIPAPTSNIEPAYLKLAVKKTIVDASGVQLPGVADLLSGKYDGKFKFTITGPADAMPTPDYAYNVGADVTFETIEFNSAGTFEYVIQEEPGNEPGILYTGETKTIIVKTKVVGSNNEKKVVIESVTYNGQTITPVVTDEVVGSDPFGETTTATSTAFRLSGNVQKLNYSYRDRYGRLIEELKEGHFVYEDAYSTSHITANSKTGYCLDVSQTAPAGQGFTTTTLDGDTITRLKKILYCGYPIDSNSGEILNEIKGMSYSGWAKRIEPNKEFAYWSDIRGVTYTDSTAANMFCLATQVVVHEAMAGKTSWSQSSHYGKEGYSDYERLVKLIYEKADALPDSAVADMVLHTYKSDVLTAPDGKQYQRIVVPYMPNKVKKATIETPFENTLNSELVIDKTVIDTGHNALSVASTKGSSFKLKISITDANGNGLSGSNGGTTGISYMVLDPGGNIIKGTSVPIKDAEGNILIAASDNDTDQRHVRITSGEYSTATTGYRRFANVTDTSEFTLWIKDYETIVFKNLPLGAIWTVEEVDSGEYIREGYVKDGAHVTTANVSGTISTQTSTVDVHNQRPLPEIIIKKVSAVGETLLDGAEFQIWTDQNSITDKWNDRPFINVFESNIQLGDNTTTSTGARCGSTAIYLNTYRNMNSASGQGGQFLDQYGFTTDGLNGPRLRMNNGTGDYIRYMPDYNNFKNSDNVRNANKVFVTGTDGDGLVSLGQLPDGKYYIVETKAPSGYNGFADPIVVTITNGVVRLDETHPRLGNTPLVTSGTANTITITNTAGEELPKTGGIGTTIIYILGSILVVGAGVLLIARKRNKN